MSSEKSPAFQFYPRDFLSEPNVQAMTMEQRGIYVWLLCHCWCEDSLPNDLARLARICQVSRRRFEMLWPEIAVCFIESDGALRHSRLDKERRDQAKRRDRQKHNAEARWHPGGNAVAFPVQCSASASASASAKEIDPPTPLSALKARTLTVEEVFGPSDDGQPDPAADHVSAVMAAWSDEWAACRNGAIFRPHPIRDYAVFKELADTYADVAHLRSMFRFFFLAPDLPDWAQSRSPRSFLRLAPETDAAVRRTA